VSVYARDVESGNELPSAETMAKDRRRKEMPSRIVLLKEAEGLSLARIRVPKPDRSFRNQNCGGRARVQDLRQPRSARSCGPDLYVCVRWSDGQVTALRYFIGTRRQNFHNTHGVGTIHEQLQRTVGRIPRTIPQVVDGKEVDL
jgi:hypothetical protein